MKKIHGKLHKYKTVKNGVPVFYVVTRLRRSYKAGCNDEPYFACVSFFINVYNMYELDFIFRISLYHKSLKQKRTMTKDFTLHGNHLYANFLGYTYNDIFKRELIKGQNPSDIRNKLLNRVRSSIGYEIAEDFVRVGLPYIINNVDFNELVQSMLFCKRGV